MKINVVHELGKARISRDFEARWTSSDLLVTLIELTSVGLHLVLKGVVTDAGAGIDNLLDKRSNFSSIHVEAEDEVAGEGSILVGGKALLVEVRDLVEVGQLAERAKEVVSGDGSLALEE